MIELGLAGNTKEAAASYSEAKKNLKHYLDRADAVIQYNENTTRQAYQTAKKRASTGRIAFIILGAFTILVGVWLSRAITRSITIPILRSSEHMRFMAKGDFSVSVSGHALKR